MTKRLAKQRGSEANSGKRNGRRTTKVDCMIRHVQKIEK